jgi:hypothetical protein
MFLIIFFLTAGILAGFFLRRKKGIIMLADKVASVAVCLLLFFLGLSVGDNDVIISSFPKLGIQALALTGGAVAGSVIISYLVHVYVFGRRGK